MAANVIDYKPPATIKAYITDFRPAELFYDWIVGPVGCLHADTLIMTEFGPIPIARIDRPMRVLSWNAETCQFQLSLCGGAFPKGTDYLYRVVTPQGEFDAAGSHLLFCTDGKYRRVSELQAGDVVQTCFRDPVLTTEALVQRSLPEDVPRWWEIAAGCLGGYAASVRQYGLRLLQVAGAGQVFAPSPDGVPECAACFSPSESAQLGDRPEQRSLHTRQGRYDDRTGKRRYAYRKANAGEGEVDSVFARLSARVAGLHQAVSRSLSNWYRGQPVQQLHEQKQLTQGSQAFSSPDSSLTTSHWPIISITRKAVKETYWDLQVMDTHNYVSIDGAIHHNSGKTTGLFFKLAYMAKKQAPGKDGIRRTRAVVVRNTAPQLMDTTLVSWNYWFKDGQAGKWMATPKTFILRFDDVECEVLFRPLDTPDDVARVLSLEVTFAILDEFVQIPMQIVDALSARLGRYPSKKDGGATNWGMWGSSNPSTEDNPWFDYLHEKLPENARYFLQPSGFSDEAENVENLPGGRAYYTNQAKGKSEAWIKQFLEAEWGFSIAGKPVVPTFNPELHVSKSPLKFDPMHPLIIGFDPGLGGSAFIFGQEDLHGRLRVYGELVQEGIGTERLITERLKPYLRRRFPNAQVVIAPDPAAANRAQNDEKSAVDIMRRHFPVKYDTNNRLTPRLNAIEHYTTRLTDVGPALLIDGKECPVLVRALKGGWRFVLDPKRDVIKSPEPEKNAYSHPGDAFGYLARHYAKLSERAERYGGKAGTVFKPPAQFGGGYHVR